MVRARARLTDSTGSGPEALDSVGRLTRAPPRVRVAGRAGGSPSSSVNPIGRAAGRSSMSTGANDHATPLADHSALGSSSNSARPASAPGRCRRSCRRARGAAGGQRQTEHRAFGLRRPQPATAPLDPPGRRERRGHLRRRCPADRPVEEGSRQARGSRRVGRQGQGLRGLPQAAGVGEIGGRGGRRRGATLARADEQGEPAGRQARVLREAAGPQRRRGPRDPRTRPPDQAGHADRHAGRLDRHVPPQHGGDPGGHARPDPRSPLLDQPQLPAQRADRPRTPTRSPKGSTGTSGAARRGCCRSSATISAAAWPGAGGWTSATATWPTWARTGSICRGGR